MNCTIDMDVVYFMHIFILNKLIKKIDTPVRWEMLKYIKEVKMRKMEGKKKKKEGRKEKINSKETKGTQ